MNLGDVVLVDFGVPVGSEPGFVRPAVVLMADSFLRFRPSVIFVAPLTMTERLFPSHVEIQADALNGLEARSWALVEQLRAVASSRSGEPTGNVGSVAIHQIHDVLAMITGAP